jgi:HTH-type transcriptional regulator / antitoxin HigA
VETKERGKMNAFAIDTKAITATWEAFQSALPFPLKPITSKAQYDRTVRLMNELLDQVGDNENHRLAFLLNTVGQLVDDYESTQVELPDATPAQTLRFLMDQNDLKQTDLANEIGAQSVVSAILAGKREINGRQAKALAFRFAVKADVFL